MRKSDMTPLRPHSRKGALVKHTGKGATEQALPPGAMSTLAAGSPASRTMNDYAKMAPVNPAPTVGMSSMPVPPDSD